MNRTLFGTVVRGFVALSAAWSFRPAFLPAQDLDTTKAVQLVPVTVTATREARDPFGVPAPVTILDSTKILERSPNNAADPFRDLPGLDINGTGPNQTRPTIRGQRGQRVLLLEDGIRVANSRRQSDFGEIPSLVDGADVKQVEVVRGPMSVLYGSDAIGGAVNLITRSPTYGMPGTSARGAVGYTYGSAGDLSKVFGNLAGRSGGLGFMAGGSYRDAGNYTVPPGSFGNITLNDKTYLYDSKVRDWSVNGYLGYRLSSGHGFFAKYETYGADHAGFGYVDPTLLSQPGQPPQPLIQILYPDQRYWKTSVGYNSPRLNGLILDRIDVTTYYSSNKRHLTNNIGIPEPAGPGSSITINSWNFTDVGTVGFRAEAKKVLGRHLLTYGVDYFRDHSNNTDSSLTTLTGFAPGPPILIPDSAPSVPNASLRSIGVFAQGEIRFLERASVILGARYQNVNRQTRDTPNLSAPLVDNTQGTVVGTANAIFGITSSLNLIGALGRGFRSPNLVESFFSGPVPEANPPAIQIANPALKPETNLEFDLGARYRTSRVSAEAWYFNNTIHDGIRTGATGDTVSGLPVFQNQNVAQLRYQGVELGVEGQVVGGFSAGASYTYLSSKDVLKPNDPIGDTYPHKVGVTATYRHPNGRFWAEYGFRFNAKQTNIPPGTNPIGNVLPGFTVHNLQGGVRLYDRGRFRPELNVAILNLADALYAETANQSFFRPEPRRQVRVGVVTTF